MSWYVVTSKKFHILLSSLVHYWFFTNDVSLPACRMTHHTIVIYDVILTLAYQLIHIGFILKPLHVSIKCSFLPSHSVWCPSGCNIRIGEPDTHIASGTWNSEFLISYIKKVFFWGLIIKVRSHGAPNMYHNMSGRYMKGWRCTKGRQEVSGMKDLEVSLLFTGGSQYVGWLNSWILDYFKYF